MGNGRVLLESLDDLYGLIGEAVALVGSSVEGLVVAIGQHVRGGDDGKNHRDVCSGIGRVPGLSGLKKLIAHLRPPPQGLHGASGKEESTENYRKLENRVPAVQQ